MNSPYKTGIIFALIWFGLRFGLGKMLEPSIALKAGIMINILFVLLSIFFVFYFTKRKNGFEESAVLEDLKLSIKGGILYVVFVSIAIFGYYNLDESLFEEKMAQFEENFQSKTQDDLIKEKNANPETKGMTTDTYVMKARENSRNWASAKTQTMISMLGLTVWCLFASLLCTFIFRKVLLAPRGR